jgi:hypothetical protein
MPDHDRSSLTDQDTPANRALADRSPLTECGVLAGQSDLANRSTLASPSLAAHLTRGAIGFGLIGAAFVLTPSAGPGALLLVAPGMLALRGCPTCWIAGLIATISAGRLERTCTEDGCTLHPPGP